MNYISHVFTQSTYRQFLIYVNVCLYHALIHMTNRCKIYTFLTQPYRWNFEIMRYLNEFDSTKRIIITFFVHY